MDKLRSFIRICNTPSEKEVLCPIYHDYIIALSQSIIGTHSKEQEDAKKFLMCAPILYPQHHMSKINPQFKSLVHESMQRLERQVLPRIRRNDIPPLVAPDKSYLVILYELQKRIKQQRSLSEKIYDGIQENKIIVASGCLAVGLLVTDYIRYLHSQEHQ